MKVFAGDSADIAWRKATRAVLQGGEASTTGSRTGPTRELLHAALEVRDPRRRWVTSRYPALNIAFALAEVVWILAGRDDVRFLQHWNAQYSKFVGTKGNAHAAYGMRLRKRFEIDQLVRAYRVLERNPDSRQVVLDIWAADEDFPFETGRPRAGDIPCNVLACLKLKNGRLEWMQVLRSNDLYLGFPHNVVQFTYVQEVLAGWLGVQPGRYTHVVSSLHAYEHHRESFDIRPSTLKPDASLDVRLPFAESERAWSRLEQLCECIVRRGGHPLNGALPNSPDLPAPLSAIFKVIAAEHSRRAGDSKRADALISSCEDPVLVKLWARWERRLANRPLATA